jgi:hypothetical protein
VRFGIAPHNFDILTAHGLTRAGSDGLKDVRCQVSPLGVALRKQRQLLFSPVSFDLLFTLGRHLRIAKAFKKHQPVDLVLSGKTIKPAKFVLHHSLP